MKKILGKKKKVAADAGSSVGDSPPGSVSNSFIEAKEAMLDGSDRSGTSRPPSYSIGPGQPTHLRVFLKRARGLAVKDSSGTSDPYAVIRLDGQKWTSRIIKHECNPEWNQEALFTMPVMSSVLTVKLWDDDGKLRRDDFLGEISIDVSPQALMANQGARWYALQQRDKSPQESVTGDIEIAIEPLGLDDTAIARNMPLMAEKPTNLTSLLKENYGEYLMKIDIQGLQKFGSSKCMRGLYVEVRIGTLRLKTSKMLEKNTNIDYDVYWGDLICFSMEEVLEEPKATGWSLEQRMRGTSAVDHVRLSLKRKRIATKAHHEVISTMLIPLSQIPMMNASGQYEGPDDSDLYHFQSMTRAQAEMSRIEEDDPEGSLPSRSDGAFTQAHALNNLPTQRQEDGALRASAPGVAGRITRGDADSSAMSADAGLDVPVEGSTSSATERKSPSKACGPTCRMSKLINRLHQGVMGSETKTQASEESDEDDEFNPAEVDPPIKILNFARKQGKSSVDLILRMGLYKPKPSTEPETDDEGDLDSTAGPEPTPVTPPEALEIPMIDCDLSCPVRKLWKTIFANESEFYNKFQTGSKYHTITNGRWLLKNSERVRTVQYTMPLSNPMGPKEAEATEEQVVETKTDGGFVVNVKATTPKVPYGTAFYLAVQIAGWHVAPGKCHLRATAKVEFVKSVMVKGMIQSGAGEGVAKTYAGFLSVLREHLGLAEEAAQAGADGAVVAVGGAAGAAAGPDRTKEIYGALGLLLLLCLLLLRIGLLLAGTNTALREDQAAVRELLAALASKATECAVPAVADVV